MATSSIGKRVTLSKDGAKKIRRVLSKAAASTRTGVPFCHVARAAALDGNDVMFHNIWSDPDAAGLADIISSGDTIGLISAAPSFFHSRDELGDDELFIAWDKLFILASLALLDDSSDIETVAVLPSTTLAGLASDPLWEGLSGRTVLLYDHGSQVPGIMGQQPSMSADDFVIFTTGGIIEETEVYYAGAVPASVLSAYKESFYYDVLKRCVCEALATSPFTTEGLPAIDILSVLSLDRNHMPGMDIARHRDYPAGMSSLLGLCDQEALAAQSKPDPQYAAAIEMEDLATIWQETQRKAMVGFHVAESEELSQVTLEEAAKAAGRLLGMDTILDAYYSGVPLEDILAGI